MRTLSEAAERTFARYYGGTKWAAKTRMALQRVVADFGDCPLDRIDADALDRFIAKMRAAGKAASTINGKLALLGKVLRFAYERGALARMPRIEREAVHNLRLRWLTPEEEATLLRLLRQYGKEDQAEVVEVLVDTGMRQSELFALMPKDVDLRGRTIRIWKTRHGGLVAKRTKNGDMRTIYMTDRVQNIIARRVARTEPDGFLFPGDVFWLRNAWDRARAAMGLSEDENFVPYICRHTCASRMVQRGVPLPVIQRWMGHRTIQMTLRYANVAPDNLWAAMETLNQGPGEGVPLFGAPARAGHCAAGLVAPTPPNRASEALPNIGT
jgi:integrase